MINFHERKLYKGRETGFVRFRQKNGKESERKREKSEVVTGHLHQPRWNSVW